MKDTDNLCYRCFDELTSGSICTHCGYDNDVQNDSLYLPCGSVLEGRYTVGAVLEQESDAVTYAAYDMQLDNAVTLREFLPKGIVNRLEGNLDVHIRERYKSGFEKYKASFLNLWTTMIKMHSLSAAITTYDVFEQNGTAYAVSERLDYISLRDFLLRNPEGNIPWEQARLMFMPVLTTLETLHGSGIIHGGICPDNLVLCRDGKMRLKGFCICEANSASSELEFNVNEGYTALEQYDNNHKICPATDIYAFSACIFRALVGQNPPDAKSRETNDKLMIPNTIAENIPTYIIKALGGGLQIYPEKRTQSVFLFREQLNASPSVVAAAAPAPQPKSEPQPVPVSEEQLQRRSPAQKQKPKNGKKAAIIILIILVLAAAAGAGVYAVRSDLFGLNETKTEAPSLSSYTVPDFISAGYTQSNIQSNAIWNEQFSITFNEEYSKEAAAGIVFKQSVKAGETVQEGTSIVLTVSKGIETAQVPDVGGMKLEDAKKQLEAAGFTVSTVEVYNEDGYAENTVKQNNGMAPAAGETVAKGEEIVLQVYGEEVTTTVPATEEDTTVE